MPSDKEILMERAETIAKVLDAAGVPRDYHSALALGCLAVESLVENQKITYEEAILRLTCALHILFKEVEQYAKE